nr:MAG TPA: hypothetical protein [Caudoviricetes sp.]
MFHFSFILLHVHTITKNFLFVKHFISFFSHKLGKMFIFLIFVKKWCIFYTFLYYFFQFQ